MAAGVRLRLHLSSVKAHLQKTLRFPLIAQTKRCFTDSQEYDNLSTDEEEFMHFEEVAPCARMSYSTWRKNSNLPPSKEKIEESVRERRSFGRAVYGRHGEASKIDPAVYCWPTKEEIEDMMELEKREWTIQEKISIIEDFRRRDKEKLKKYQENIAVAMHNMPSLVEKLKEKKQIEEKKEEEKQVKVMNELEEARAIYGRTLNFRDPIFIQYLAEKKAEQSRLKKEQKKKDQAEFRKRQRSLY